MALYVTYQTCAIIVSATRMVGNCVEIGLSYWSQPRAVTHALSPITPRLGSARGVIATRTGGPGLAYAVMSTGGRPRTKTTVDSTPATVPSVQRVLASPSELVTVSAGEYVFPRLMARHETGAPTSYVPSARRTWTTRGYVSVDPTVPCCPSPLRNPTRCESGSWACALKAASSPQQCAITR